jgi:hypothetical protein
MDPESLQRYHDEEAKDRLLTFVGEIVCKRTLCCFCKDLKDAALREASKGPEAFLVAVRDFQGMQCGCVEWMKERATDAIGFAKHATP